VIWAQLFANWALYVAETGPTPREGLGHGGLKA